MYTVQWCKSRDTSARSADFRFWSVILLNSLNPNTAFILLLYTCPLEGAFTFTSKCANSEILKARAHSRKDFHFTLSHLQKSWQKGHANPRKIWNWMPNTCRFKEKFTLYTFIWTKTLKYTENRQLPDHLKSHVCAEDKCVKSSKGEFRNCFVLRLPFTECRESGAAGRPQASHTARTCSRAAVLKAPCSAFSLSASASACETNCCTQCSESHVLCTDTAKKLILTGTSIMAR